MRRVMLHILGLLCVVNCLAQRLVFSSLDTSEGLSDHYVFQMTQLQDGRMAVVTAVGIDVWDGKTFRHVKLGEKDATPIGGYRGAIHLYADGEGRLWVKNYGRVWCYNAGLKRVPRCIPDDANDLFVDDQGEVFFVQQDSTDMLFDLKTMGGKQYRFYASGTVRCLNGGREVYACQAALLDSTAHTSMVVADTLREKFYQLVDGKLCLEFDTRTRQWTELFRSEKLHTIALTNPNTAIIVSHDALWMLDLPSRKAERLDQVRMQDGSYLSSSRLNTVFADRSGTVWLGTYDHGLLYCQRSTPWYRRGSTHLLLALGVLLMAGGLGGFLWMKRRKRKTVLPAAEERHLSAEHADLIRRATTLVEENLTTPNYTVERLAADLCMDRTGLYKKMTAAIDKTPTAFIRNIRLNHAAQLIRQGDLTITEVAERTGFSSASYMSRCFQEEWGKKPGELRAIST
ncbi:MAG: helix-turn-helix transcriptional regulator [Bacteroidaceae bacterium]|nr:helix-turn-helix transcriptional regulator [Bacteroidaceae bacterium]